MNTPHISIVIEAYNEAHAAMAVHLETMDALLEQDYPLEQVEVVLVGSQRHIAGWDAMKRGPWQVFHSVQALAVEEVGGDGHYWSLKNYGSRAARGEIIAFVDSDVTPQQGWLRAIDEAFRQGAPAVVGPSMFRSRHFGPRSLVMTVAANISWGFVLAPMGADGRYQANSLLGHNVAVRRDLLERYSFPADTRRSFGSNIFFNRLQAAGFRPWYLPGMRAAHAMTWNRWIATRHFRGGWESYERWRDCDPGQRRWARFGLLEPLLDVLSRYRWSWSLWFRYSKAVGYPGWKSILVAPLAMLAAGVAMTVEMAGMYANRFAPARTERYAQF